MIEDFFLKKKKKHLRIEKKREKKIKRVSRDGRWMDVCVCDLQELFWAPARSCLEGSCTWSSTSSLIRGGHEGGGIFGFRQRALLGWCAYRPEVEVHHCLEGLLSGCHHIAHVHHQRKLFTHREENRNELRWWRLNAHSVRMHACTKIFWQFICLP